jgi:hypothetical protein
MPSSLIETTRRRRAAGPPSLIDGCLQVIFLPPHGARHDRTRARTSGVVTVETRSVVVTFGEGESALVREVRVTHQIFPNRGSWSFFVCPACGRPARILKLHEKPMCRRCCLGEGIGYRVSSGSPVERDVARLARLQKLRELLDGWTADGRLPFRGGGE